MKILCSDYDGTFNIGGIDDRKRNAVKRWRESGNLFGFVTGRAIETISEIIRHDGVECDFAVANNGAVIGRPDGSIIADTRCPSSRMRELVETMFELGCPCACFSSSERSTVYRVPPKTPDPDERTLDESLSRLDYFTQVSTYLPNTAKAHAVTVSLAEQFSGYITPLQNGICIDIVPFGIDKAVGIHRLTKLLGASMDDVIAVGDNINDEAMIREFRSYAVANAVDMIKSLADDVCADIVDLIDREM